MLDALNHSHLMGVANRDLKIENILLDSDLNVKIADFGLAAPVAGRNGLGWLHTYVGTEGYMAPEIFELLPIDPIGKRFPPTYKGHEVDLFALGVILFVLYANQYPF
jgi:serine/threonine protein kinase